MDYKDLSSEQQRFIDLALEGHNVLVDACIGSGKTTTIQCLCRMIDPKKYVLYLTYNTLLKLDAQERIGRKDNHIRVTNFHGFSGEELSKYGIASSRETAVTDYNRSNLPPPKCDVLILDEYQDVKGESAELLAHINEGNPDMQVVAVGDMAQKISDNTRLDVESFIQEFLGCKLYYKMEFTKCFRLSRPLAAKLGEIWNKRIDGVNPCCGVFVQTFRQTLEYLKTLEPKDILCLGANKGLRNTMLNMLEKECPSKFNKFTVWSKISEKDGGTTSPDKNTAIFTTYDGCKGMERDVCVVFDWSESYWNMRLDMPQTKYEIMRNIFCVAASRGKKRVIFVAANDPLGWDTLGKVAVTSDRIDRSVNMSQMFDFKYVEDVEDAYNYLQIKEISPQSSVINAPTSEGMIDLSPCIGIYQEVAYFDECSIDGYIQNFFEHNSKKRDRLLEIKEEWTLDEKVLFYVSLETDQKRYMDQVTLPLVSEGVMDKICKRLATVFPRSARAQSPCQLLFEDNKEVFTAYGIADVIKDDTVYELKFVSELAHTHFLQCAMYMAAKNLSRGVLWNVRNNQQYEIRIPDVKTFLSKAIYAATKGSIRPFSNTAVPALQSSNESAKVKNVDGNSGKKTPAKNRASCNRALFGEFCDKNRSACEKVVRMTKQSKLNNKEMGRARIERAFNELGVSLPFPARTFERYWRAYCEGISETAGKVSTAAQSGEEAAGQGSAEQVPAKQQTSNYRVLFERFCNDNKNVCKKVAEMSENAKRNNESMGRVKIERAFNELGVNLPFPARTFERYWKECCESMLKEDAKKRGMWNKVS